MYVTPGVSAANARRIAFIFAPSACERSNIVGHVTLRYALHRRSPSAICGALALAPGVLPRMISRVPAGSVQAGAADAELDLGLLW